MEKFNLSNEQIDLILRLFAEEPIVKKVLECRKENEFIVSVDDKIEFMGFIEDMTVLEGMDSNYDPTPDGYIMESIYDSIYAQTN